MRNLIILIAVVVAVLIVRSFMRSSPEKAAKFIRQFGLAIAAGLLLFLLMTGRLPWLFGLAAAAIPFARRLLPMLRYVPFLHNLLRRYQTGKANQAGPASGQTSSVEARFVRMLLDHDSGSMDGKILHGMHKGAHLAQLTLQQLVALLGEWQDQSSGDNDSAALLQAYLDRMHPDWHSRADSAGYSYDTSDDAAGRTLSGRDDMSRTEALQILGLTDTATQADIIAAHKHLMQKNHPDRGGSTWLAAKINLAKERLTQK